MENLVMRDLFQRFYDKRKVFVTGHTGFKGSWLSLWLSLMGAEIGGYSVNVPTQPSNFELSGIGNHTADFRGDVRDFGGLERRLRAFSPEVVFHLAAQPVVLTSYQKPMETFDVNVLGTVNLLEAVRNTPSVKSVVIVTSDKCYENQEFVWGYRENDSLGGSDPYSASKAMVEIAVNSYRKSFFREMGVGVATARAGNVVGGGDFAEFRLIPDCIRALTREEPVQIRNPQSVRPWQTVFEPLSGYLVLGKELIEDGEKFSQPWNFGPNERRGIKVEDVMKQVIASWGSGTYSSVRSDSALVETPFLRLNWDKAAEVLGWNPTYVWEEAVDDAVSWYKKFHMGLRMPNESVKSIEQYVSIAKLRGCGWAQ